MPDDSGNIEFAEDTIRYTSARYPDWTIRVDDIRVIGEATNQNGPWADDYFICFATGPEMWHEASFYASGLETLLSTLSARLGIKLQLSLIGSTDFASRIHWPPELADTPMFQYEDVPPRTVVGRLLGSLSIRQTYSDHVLAAFQRDA